VAERETGARVAVLGRARRAGASLALALAAFAACGRGDVPPVPDEFHRLEQREAGCLACHDGRRAPTLDPRVTATPSDHPPLAIAEAARALLSREQTAGESQALASRPE